MPSFHYSGRDIRGGLVEGSILAANHGAAVSQLQQSDIVVTRLELETESKAKVNVSLQLFKKKVTLDDQVLLTRQLYALTKAGIPIIRAFNGLAESTDNESLAEVLNALADSLIAGSELATAFRQFPKIFTQHFNIEKHKQKNNKGPK